MLLPYFLYIVYIKFCETDATMQWIKTQILHLACWGLFYSLELDRVWSIYGVSLDDVLQKPLYHDTIVIDRNCFVTYHIKSFTVIVTPNEPVLK